MSSQSIRKIYLQHEKKPDNIRNYTYYNQGGAFDGLSAFHRESTFLFQFLVNNADLLSFSLANPFQTTSRQAILWRQLIGLSFK